MDVFSSPIIDIAASLADLDVLLMGELSAMLLPDIEKIADWALHTGACVLWHGLRPEQFSALTYELLGAAAVDFRSPVPFNITYFGRTWVIPAVRNRAVHVELGLSYKKSWSGATVLARDGRGIPALLHNMWGNGSVVFLSSELVTAGFPTQILEQWYTNELRLCNKGQSPSSVPQGQSRVIV